MPSWHIEDAEPIAAASRYTFYKSPVEAIRKVTVGELVKLIFRFKSDDPNAPTAERMWVEVEEIAAGGVFKGRLDNHPKYISDLKIGDPVEFQACHIINTEHDDHDNIVERYIKRCYVTHRILYDGDKVAFLYREDPDDENDSGWRLTAGLESEEYMDDSKNHSYVSLGAVLSVDDSFISLLDSPVGSEFIRESENGPFVPCADDP